MGDPQRYEYEELDDLLAAEDAADNALITVAEEEALLGELKDLDDERVKEITEAETDAELAKLEATLAEGEKEEEEEEDLDAQLAELNNEQEITDAEADAQLAALEAEFEETAEGDDVVLAAPAAVAPAAEKKGWFHRTTGFSSNRIPGWQRMRAMTGWGRKTRKRRKARKPRRTRRKRRARKTRRKRKTRKPRRKRKTRRKRRRRR